VFTCVQYTHGVTGRPFLVGTRERVAASEARADWARVDARPEVDALSPRDRAALAAHWQRAGLMEHASIAAFARFTLHLLALGAPPSLVAQSNGALGDEMAHAEFAFAIAIASAYAGAPVGPGPLAIDGALDGFGQVAFLETLVREGCIGETLAALEAREGEERAVEPVLRRVLGIIARDEFNHAALAWRTLAWLLDTGRVGRVQARTTIDRALQEQAALARVARVSAENANLDRFGVLSESERKVLRAVACESVVAPCADALLGPRTAERPRPAVQAV